MGDDKIQPYGVQNGNQIELGVNKTFSDGPHRLDTNAHVNLTSNLQGPHGLGGGANYYHQDAGLGAGVQVQHTPSFGTNVGVTGTANLYRDRDTSLDFNVGRNQHFGGPFKSAPNHSAMLSFTKRF